VLEAASPVRQPSGILAVARWQPEDAGALVETATGPIVGLVDVQDPGNVGVIIRSADALGAAAVLALDASANPGGWKTLRAAMGSTFRLPIGVGQSETALAAARRRALPVVASIARGGVALFDWTPPSTFLLLVGNEGGGIPASIATVSDNFVTIPMRSGVESLNVGVSTALVLSEAWRRARPIS
jgi:TrmH family RNA methyltransferase